MIECAIPGTRMSSAVGPWNDSNGTAGLTGRLTLAAITAQLAVIAAVGAAIMLLCGGRLIYGLDDPYISLSFGWHLAHGQFGLNPGEPAWPTSSILYLFLLAAFAW